ncbi:hypothetical protein [Vibrio coralliilyticus]|uniref:hypothetical protein n=1 Tax=Vibrio coralliilyticus TaxID=190893 RepID=UPI000C170C48|nr:hypothetical protein [Vibrio coralliilyticus]
MRYKTMALGLFFCSLSVQAASLDPWAEQLEQEMHAKYTVLNERVSACKAMRKSFDYAKPLNEGWFKTLDTSEQQKVIQFGFAKASQQCSAKEREAYAGSMLDYVAYTGDKEPLNEWLVLVEGDKELQQDINSIGVEQTQKFVKQHLNTPFDALRLLKSQGLF